MSQISRRLFVAGSAATALFARNTPEVIGVQLYTVRSVLPKDPAKTIEAIEQIGYREAEVIWGSLDAIWPALSKSKLKPVSMHLDSGLFKPENESKLSAAIAHSKELGFQYVVYPYVMPNERGGADAFKKLADTLSHAGAECKKAGLQLCYHNHAFEFEPQGSTTGMDILLSQSDKSLVQLEMDMFWVSVAGHDPVEMLKKNAGRIPLLHVKDKAEGTPVQFNERVPREDFKEAGKGVLKMPEILAQASKSGVKHYFVEQDQTPGDPIDSLKISYNYLRSLKA